MKNFSIYSIEVDGEEKYRGFAYLEEAIKLAQVYVDGGYTAVVWRDGWVVATSSPPLVGESGSRIDPPKM